MTRPDIRPGRPADWLAFYGEPPKRTVRPIVADLDGKILGVAGLERQHGFYVAFSDISDDMRKHKTAMLRAGKMLVDMIKECRLPVVGIQNKDEPTSINFLTHLGFVPTEEPEVLVWPG